MRIHERGVISLVTSLMVALMLTTFVVVSGYDVWFARSDIVDRESFFEADMSARSCIDIGGRYALSHTPIVTPLTVVVTDHTCHIDAISTSSNDVFIATESTVNQVKVGYDAVIESSDPVHIVSIHRR